MRKAMRNLIDVRHFAVNVIASYTASQTALQISPLDSNTIAVARGIPLVSVNTKTSAVAENSKPLQTMSASAR